MTTRNKPELGVIVLACLFVVGYLGAATYSFLGAEHEHAMEECQNSGYSYEFCERTLR
jgi:hypothetical protein